MGNNISALWAEVTAKIPTVKEKVWEVLTHPKLTEKYMYNCQLHSSWELGSKAVWQEPLKDGSWQDHVVGEVLAYTPCEHLEIKIFHKAAEGKPAESSYLHFNLKSIAEGTELIIKQGDFHVIPSGEKSYLSCQQGWEYVLPKLIETCKEMLDDER